MQRTVNGTAFVADRILAATGIGALGAGLLAQATDMPIPKNGVEYIGFGLLAFVLLAWAKARVEAADEAWKRREELMQTEHAKLEEKFQTLLVESNTTLRDALMANTNALQRFERFFEKFSETWNEMANTPPCVAMNSEVRERLHRILDEEQEAQD